MFAIQQNTLFLRIAALAYFCSPGLSTDLLSDPIDSAYPSLMLENYQNICFIVCVCLRGSAVS